MEADCSFIVEHCEFRSRLIALSNKYLSVCLKVKLLLNSLSLRESEVSTAPWNLCAGEHKDGKSSIYQTCRSFSWITLKRCSKFCHAASCSCLTSWLSYNIRLYQSQKFMKWWSARLTSKNTEPEISRYT